MHLCESVLSYSFSLYLSSSVYVYLPLSPCACKCLKNVAQVAAKAEVCMLVCAYVHTYVSKYLRVCMCAYVYCNLQLQNARAAISRLVSSPSAKINMFVPGKTPLWHFSTFTLALQVRQAMPRPLPLTHRVLGGWAFGRRVAVGNANATAAKVNALQENALHTHRRAPLTPKPGPARGCWHREQVPGPVWPIFATIKCYETLKVLSESANDAHETETANGNEMQQLREFLSTCCCCCCR